MSMSMCSHNAGNGTVIMAAAARKHHRMWHRPLKTSWEACGVEVWKLDWPRGQPESHANDGDTRELTLFVDIT